MLCLADPSVRHGVSISVTFGLLIRQTLYEN